MEFDDLEMEMNSKMSDFELNMKAASLHPMIINDDQSASLKSKSSSVLMNDLINTVEVNFVQSWGDFGELMNENPKKWKSIMKPVLDSDGNYVCAEAEAVSKTFNWSMLRSFVYCFTADM